MSWVGNMMNPPEMQEGAGGADLITGGDGASSMGFGGQDFESLFQEMMGLVPRQADRQGLVGDSAAGIQRGDFMHLGAGEVQREGDMQASALRNAQKKLLGRDPRSKLSVDVDGMRFFRDAQGNVVPFTDVTTTAAPKDIFGGSIGPAHIGEAEAIPEGFSANADPKMLAKARAQAQKKAEALLLGKEREEAQRMPDTLEAALLAGAEKIKPGDNPQSMFQAIIQRAGAARTKEDQGRIKQAFDMALKKAGFLERVEAREERGEDRRTAAADRVENRKAVAEDRRIRQATLDFQKEQAIERKTFERTQSAAQGVMREVNDIINNVEIDDTPDETGVSDRERATDKYITSIHATMDDDTQPVFAKMMRRAFGWVPAEEAAAQVPGRDLRGQPTFSANPDAAAPAAGIKLPGGGTPATQPDAAPEPHTFSAFREQAEQMGFTPEKVAEGLEGDLDQLIKVQKELIDDPDKFYDFEGEKDSQILDALMASTGIGGAAAVATLPIELDRVFGGDARNQLRRMTRTLISQGMDPAAAHQIAQEALTTAIRERIGNKTSLPKK